MFILIILLVTWHSLLTSLLNFLWNQTKIFQLHILKLCKWTRLIHIKHSGVVEFPNSICSCLQNSDINSIYNDLLHCLSLSISADSKQCS